MDVSGFMPGVIQRNVVKMAFGQLRNNSSSLENETGAIRPDKLF